jgi:hypothetical protein
MKRGRLLLVLLCAGLFSLSSTACVGGKATPAVWQSVTKGQTVLVVGVVRRVGNDPFTHLVIFDSQEKDWYLDEAAEKLLSAYEQRNVKIVGVVELKHMIFADGSEPLPPNRILHDVKIVE